MTDSFEDDLRGASPRSPVSRRDLLSLGALGAGATLLAQGVARADNGVGLKIGLVDIGRVFKEYKRKDFLEKEVNAKKDTFEKQAQAQDERIQGLRKGMQIIPPSGELYRQKKKELNLEMASIKVTRDGWEEDLKAQIENLTLLILNEIEDRVRKFGSDNKFDMIIKIDSQGWGDERFQERIFRAQVSSVLYFDPKLDVTEGVLKLLNDPEWIKQCEQKKMSDQIPQPAPPPPPQPPK